MELMKMKPTKEGFLMNTLRRIPRHMVKALAAGAVMLAAALPLAAATEASAAGTPAALASVTEITPTAGSFIIGSGATGTISFTGTNLVNDGGNVSLSTTAPGVTFTSVIESSTTAGTASFASTAATTPGTYTVSLTDDSVVTPTPLAGALVVTPAPTVATLSPATLTAGTATQLETVTGTGFVNGATVALTNTTNGTTLTGTGTATYVSPTSLTFTASPTLTASGTPAAAAGTYALTVTNPNGGTVTAGTLTLTAFGISNVSPSAVPVPTGAVSNTPITISGSGFQQNATVTVPTTGNDASLKGGITGVTAGAITFAASPAFAAVGDFVVDSTTAGNVATGAYITNISGDVVTLSDTTGAVATTLATAKSDTLTLYAAAISVSTVAPTGITGTLTVAPGLATTLLNVTVTDTGTDGATNTVNGAIGIGEASSVAPTITATSPSTAITPGAAGSTLTITGTGLSQYDTTVAAFVGTTTASATGVSIGSCAGNTGTSIACTLTVGNGATAGPDSITVNGSNEFAAAVTVAGPSITSMSPTAIAVGAPIGTVITLTGTGFNNTATAVFGASGSLRGVLSYVSATSATFVVTASPNGTDVTTAPTLAISETVAAGVTVQSVAFKIAVTAAPAVTGAITYVTGTTAVGAGATAQKIVINGTGFATGATVTAFTNSNGVADTAVAATVTAVNAAGTTISATVAVPAGDVNLSDGYTVTNTNGGVTKVLAFGTGSLALAAGPTITTVAPSNVSPSTTVAFTVTGTGFGTGTVASTNATTSTCGPTTVVSATSLTVSCTFTTVVKGLSLVVTNANGGVATSVLTVPVVVVTPPVTVGLRTTGVHGSAVVGKTVTVTISGTGFYGQPKITSNEAGTKAVVSHDSGKLLTVRVTVKAGSRTGEHTFTIRLANGKSAKANYSVKK
jgi:hypothetical protein